MWHKGNSITLSSHILFAFATLNTLLLHKTCRQQQLFFSFHSRSLFIINHFFYGMINCKSTKDWPEKIFESQR